MTKAKNTPTNTPHAQPPGEVERDNDAHRSSSPGQPNRDSTAQSTAHKVQPTNGKTG